MSKLVNWAKYHDGSGAAGKVFCDKRLGLDKNLYHRLSWSWGSEIFKNRQLRLGPVRQWDDLYEKWWCDGLFGRKTRLNGINAYAMCWTRTSFDEPAWRMVAHTPPPVVRLTCPVTALLESAKSCDPAVHNGRWFLGVVRYARTKTLHELARDIQGGLHKEVSRTAADMLMLKRNAFRFEKEVRLLYLERGNPKDEIFLPFPDASRLLKVMISPYATASQASRVRAQAGRYGFDAKQSKVLEAPPWPT